MITWILAAALATIAGTLYGLDKSFRPFTYFQLLLPIFAAAIVGGIGQPLGAIAGGFIIAFSEVMVTYAYKGFLAYILPEAWQPDGPRADARHRLQVRRLLHHPGRGAAGPADRHLPGTRDMTGAARVVVALRRHGAADRRRRPRPGLGGRAHHPQSLPDLGGDGARRQHPVGLRRPLQRRHHGLRRARRRRGRPGLDAAGQGRALRRRREPRPRRALHRRSPRRRALRPRAGRRLPARLARPSDVSPSATS